MASHAQAWGNAVWIVHHSVLLALPHLTDNPARLPLLLRHTPPSNEVCKAYLKIISLYCPTRSVWLWVEWYMVRKHKSHFDSILLERYCPPLALFHAL